MGKIWMKTKYDEGMQMRIPHNHNIANAMYGFRELGAEIIPYYDLNSIYNDFERDDILLDYIEQCNAIFLKFNADPKIPDYPKALEPYLGRCVWKDTINSISANEEKWSAGYFVKPVKSKVFTGRVISSINDLVGCGSSYENYEVIVSEPIDIIAEWRCFILYDRIIDVRPYGSVSDLQYRGYMYNYDSSILRGMLGAFVKWDERPTACAMDICIVRDGRTLLVEINDAYALGSYGLPSLLYAKMISARWSQLLRRRDEYHY